MRFTPDHITQLKPNEIFVFGSNEAGIHGAGAAKIANRLFGAEFGKGVGMTGRTYAIPTKNHMIRTLSLHAIQKYVLGFLAEAKRCSQLTFLVTEIGCGLAGYSAKDIAPFFNNAPENVVLPKKFCEVLNLA
jgi:hypothetical protein